MHVHWKVFKYLTIIPLLKKTSFNDLVHVVHPCTLKVDICKKKLEPKYMCILFNG